MARVGWKRTWIKLYPIDCLDGSIRYQLEADERGVWYDLLNFSAICATPGLISDKDERPYPHQFIANRLNIAIELLERTLAKCIDEGRIKENSNGILISNFHAYQSEYLRQKPYRQKAINTTIFDAWNSAEVICHTKLTEDIGRAIQGALKDSTQGEICQAIKNYAEIVKDEQYYFKYKWTLKEFLRRGLEKFMDLDIAKQNYKKDDRLAGKGQGSGQATPPSRYKPVN